MIVATDIMTREVVTVSLDTPVSRVAETLAGQRFGSLPVVDEERHVHGIVTEEDLVERLVELHLPRHITFLGSIIYLENPQRFTEEAQKILAVTVKEIMDTTVPFVRPDTPVQVIAASMLKDDLRRMVVLDSENHLAGIITRADIVRLQAEKDRLPESPAG